MCNVFRSIRNIFMHHQHLVEMRIRHNIVGHHCWPGLLPQVYSKIAFLHLEKKELNYFHLYRNYLKIRPILPANNVIL